MHNKVQSVHNELEASNLYESHLTAASIPEIFALCASSVSPITSLYSRFSVTCSTTLYTTNRILLLLLFSIDVLRMSSSNSSMLVHSSLVTIPISTYLTFFAINSSSFVRRFLMWPVSVRQVPCRGCGCHSSGCRCTFAYNASSQTDTDRSSCASFLVHFERQVLRGVKCGFRVRHPVKHVLLQACTAVYICIIVGRCRVAHFVIVSMSKRACF